MLTDKLTDNFKNFAEVVRNGGSLDEDGGTVSPDNPIWVKFARAMAPLMAMPAQLMAKLVDPAADGKLIILDIAAGHGFCQQRFHLHRRQRFGVGGDKSGAAGGQQWRAAKEPHQQRVTIGPIKVRTRNNDVAVRLQG